MRPPTEPLLELARRAGIASTEAELDALGPDDRAALERIAALARERREAETITPASERADSPASAPAPAGREPIGRLGRYVLLEEIGRGGMGVVYRARDPVLDRPCAVKVLRAEDAGPAALDRFAHEARIAARIGRHPHVVPVFELGEEPAEAAGGAPRPFIAMELVEGRTLDRVLADGPLAPRAAAELGRKVASALAHAHRHGLIHRDVKPSNILLDARGEPHVTDFGLAKELEAGASLEQNLVGTPAYMPPEQAGGGASPDARSDVYSLGATLYHCVSGRAPFPGGTVAGTVARVLHDDPEPPRRLRREVPRDLETIVLRALEKDPARRYASAEDLEDDLRRFLEGEPIRAARTGPLGRLARRARRHPRQAALVGAALLAVGLGAGLLAKTVTARAAAARRDRADAILLQLQDRLPVAARIQIATAALAEDPTCFKAALARGRLRNIQGEALHRRDADGARALGELADRDLTLAIALQPETAAAYFERGLVRTRLLGRSFEECEADFRLAVELGHTSALPHLVAGFIANSERRPADAERHFIAATQADPVDSYSWTRLAAARLDLADEAGALHAVDRALLLDPGSYEGLVIRGRIRLAQGDATGARTDGERAIRLGLEDPRAYTLRSCANRLLGHAQDALADADAALAMAPRYPDARLNRACALALVDRFEEAATEIEALLRSEAAPLDALFVRAFVRAARGDRGAALTDLSTALKQGLRAEPLIVRSSIRFAEGDVGGAAEDVEAAIRLAPDWGFAYAHRGLLRAALFDLPGAALDHDAAVDRSPEDPRVWEERGIFRRSLGNVEAALADFGRAIDADVYRARALGLRGSLHVDRGEIEAAARDFQAALLREPGARDALIGLARIAARRGDPDAARTFVRRALAAPLPADPDDVRAFPELATVVDGSGPAR